MKRPLLFAVATVILCLVDSAPSGNAPKIPALDKLSTTLISPFSERLCDDLTKKICRNTDGYWMRYSVYDPATGTCVCSTQPSDYMIAKQCPDTACESALSRIYYWPTTGECFCEGDDFLSRAWNSAENMGGPLKSAVYPVEQYSSFKNKFNAFNQYLQAVAAALANPDSKVRLSELRDLNDKARARDKRQTPTSEAPANAAVEPVVPAFIPPPKHDITPELIQQSLTVQPQNTATISGVTLHAQANVITFHVQLNGMVADTLYINASTVLQCGTIGAEKPDISVVPKYVRQGQGQVEPLIPNCLCFAVNMLSPNVIDYYVVDEQNNKYSLTSSNKVIDIDKLDTSMPAALALVSSPAGLTRRDGVVAADAVAVQQYQFDVPCDQLCIYPDMEFVQVSKDHCTCQFVVINQPPSQIRTSCDWPECPSKSEFIQLADDICVCQNDNEKSKVSERGMTAPDMYSATMSKEACDAITCSNNGGKPAMFNDLSLTCWCIEPAYIEDNPSAWIPSTGS